MADHKLQKRPLSIKIVVFSYDTYDLVQITEQTYNFTQNRNMRQT